MNPPSHLSAAAKRNFRNLVDKLTELNHLHEVDIYQVERAAILIEDGRRIQKEMFKVDIDQNFNGYISIRKIYYDNTVKLNAVLDKLGVSYTKRNPYKEKRGRPRKGYTNESTSAESEWMRILENVPSSDPTSKTN